MPRAADKKRKFPLTVPQILVLGFALYILCGAVMLWLPISSENHTHLRFMDALFTATSAVCVTGLVVVDTGKTFNHVGEGVLIALMQVGGLGIMTFSSIAILLAGGRISYRFRMLLKEQLNRLNMRSIIDVTRAVVILTFIIEAAAFLILWIHWGPKLGWGDAAWQAFFHAVSAFCNAGFSIFSDNLAGWRNDIVVNTVICSLIVLGGIGFTVQLELLSFRKGMKLSLHTRVVLMMTALLIVLGAVLIFFFEIYRHPAAIHYTSIFDRIMTAVFQSITTRTAGFNTIDIGAMSEASLFVIIILMYIGASPGGTGGGIKTTTFTAIAATVYATFRGKHDVELFNRRLSPDLVRRSLAISILAQGIVWATALLCVAISGGNFFLKFLFEAMSAFGTVGLSTGITPYMTDAQKVLIMMTMFIGRLGPLTMAMAFAHKGGMQLVRKPEAEILIG